MNIHPPVEQLLNLLAPWINRTTGRIPPNIPIYIEGERYVVRTVSDWNELRQVLQLRYRVFYGELKGDLRARFKNKIDIDHFDHDSDHLVVVEKSSRKIIATYRLRSSLFCKKFYSQTEFQMDPIIQRPEPKLELGRACIDPLYRNGIVIQVLWKGILEYLARSRSQILFGCSSVGQTHPVPIETICDTLRNSEHLLPNTGIQPLKNYQWKRRELIPIAPEGENLLPSLIRFYLKAGAKLVAPPAYDAAFKCYDFLTVLNISDIPERVVNRINKCG